MAPLSESVQIIDRNSHKALWGEDRAALLVRTTGREQTDVTNLHLVDLRNARTSLVLKEVGDGEWLDSPGSRLLVTRRSTTAGYALDTLDTGTHQLDRLAVAACDHQTSPDGRHLLVREHCTSYRGRLVLIDTNDHTRRALGADVVGAVLSPDGRSVAFVENHRQSGLDWTGTLWLLHQEARIAVADNVDGLSMAFLDNQRLVFEQIVGPTDRQIVTFDPNVGQSTQYTTNRQLRATDPGGRWLLVEDGPFKQRTLLALDTLTGQEIFLCPLSPDTWQSGLFVASGVVVYVEGPSEQLILHPLGGKRRVLTRRLVSDPYDGSFDLTTDRAHIVFHERHPDRPLPTTSLVLFDLRRGTRVVVTDATFINPGSVDSSGPPVAFTANGQGVVFLRQSNESLRLMAGAAGAEPVEITHWRLPLSRTMLFPSSRATLGCVVAYNLDHDGRRGTYLRRLPLP